ncbi:uncharacterized protein [Ptychodera flava]|uniref:uncharacterized protein n=1 Tax=Ptychodera flava TaxID=63121 RepID=UPI00396AAFAF
MRGTMAGFSVLLFLCLMDMFFLKCTSENNFPNPLTQGEDDEQLHGQPQHDEDMLMKSSFLEDSGRLPGNHDFSFGSSFWTHFQSGNAFPNKTIGSITNIFSSDVNKPNGQNDDYNWVGEWYLHELMGTFSDMVGFDVSNPHDICPGVVEILSNRDRTVADYVDEILDRMLRVNVRMGARLCHGAEDKDSFNEGPPKHSEHGETDSFNDGPPQHSEDMHKEPEWDFGHIMGVVFTAIGDYGDSDELCHDVQEATADDADPSLTDDLVSRMHSGLMDALHHPDTCVHMLNRINEGLDGIMDYSVLGFDSVEAYCAALASAMDPDGSLQVDIHAFDPSSFSHIEAFQTPGYICLDSPTKMCSK